MGGAPRESDLPGREHPFLVHNAISGFRLTQPSHVLLKQSAARPRRSPSLGSPTAPPPALPNAPLPPEQRHVGARLATGAPKALPPAARMANGAGGGELYLQYIKLKSTMS